MTRVRSSIASGPLLALAVAALIAGLAAFVLLYFEPQKLLIDDEVNEALPAATSETAQPGDARGHGRTERPRTLARGEFRGLEHGASGRAVLLETRGKRYLRFEDFETSNGPDLRVYLSAAPSTSGEDAFDDDFIELGELKGNIGNQNYAVPESVNLSRFRSAVVWCKRFSAGFAVAPVEAVRAGGT